MSFNYNSKFIHPVRNYKIKKPLLRISGGNICKYGVASIQTESEILCLTGQCRDSIIKCSSEHKKPRVKLK